MISDKERHTNLIHYGTYRCKLVTRSMMAAEVNALILGFDQASVMRDLLREFLGRRVDIPAYVDNRTLFDIIANRRHDVG